MPGVTLAGESNIRFEKFWTKLREHADRHPDWLESSGLDEA